MPEEKRDRGRRRLARFGARARSRPWAALAVANKLPLTAAAVVWIAYARGKITFVPGARSVLPILTALGIALAVLVFLCWIAAPLLPPAVAGVRGFIGRQSGAIARGGPVAFVVRFPPLVAGMLVYAALWFNALVLALLIVVDIVAIITTVAVLAREVL